MPGQCDRRHARNPTTPHACTRTSSIGALERETLAPQDEQQQIDREIVLSWARLYRMQAQAVCEAAQDQRWYAQMLRADAQALHTTRLYLLEVQQHPRHA